MCRRGDRRLICCRSGFQIKIANPILTRFIESYFPRSTPPFCLAPVHALSSSWSSPVTPCRSVTVHVPTRQLPRRRSLEVLLDDPLRLPLVRIPRPACQVYSFRCAVAFGDRERIPNLHLPLPHQLEQARHVRRVLRTVD